MTKPKNVLKDIDKAYAKGLKPLLGKKKMKVKKMRM